MYEDIKSFQEGLHKIEEEYSKLIYPILNGLNKRSKQFIGKEVIIPYGIYKGRIGKITTVNLVEGKVWGIIQPYKLDTHGKITKELLWSRADARTFWNLEGVQTLIGEKNYV